MLEDRLTPSAGSFYWMGVNNKGYSDVANWYKNADHSLPLSGDQIFVGNGSVSSSFTVPSAYAFSSLTLAASFTGTVTVPDDLSVGSLTISGGNPVQGGSAGAGGNDLFVTQTLSFTGGTLNSGGNFGTVHITGDALNGGTEAFLGGSTLPTLRLGSILSVEGSGGNAASSVNRRNSSVGRPLVAAKPSPALTNEWI